MERCYVVACHAGSRRRFQAFGFKDDPAYYIRHHVRYVLSLADRIKLLLIVVSRCTEEGRRGALDLFLGTLPGRVGATRVRVLRRSTNDGYSYGCLSDAVEEIRDDEFEWVFFNEDDYAFCVRGFDTKLVRMMADLGNCGYLAAHVFGEAGEPGRHACFSAGLFRLRALLDLRAVLGEIPHAHGEGYAAVESLGQSILGERLEKHTGWRFHPISERYNVVYMDGHDGVPHGRVFPSLPAALLSKRETILRPIL